MIESRITRGIVAWINGRPQCRAIKMHSGGSQGAGEPDVFSCIRGRLLLMEVKRPGQKARPLQVRMLESWSKAGAATTVVTSLAEAQTAVRILLDLPLPEGVEFDGQVTTPLENR